MTDLIVIAGPIAAGKSTVAAALTARLRASGMRVAVIGLDEIADVAERADWPAAHRIFASAVGQWVGSSVDLVVAEGPGSTADVEAVLAAAPAVRTIVCVVEASLEVALARALADPTRVISRDPDFLAREYARWTRERSAADLVIDTGRTAVEGAVAAIRRAMAPPS